MASAGGSTGATAATGSAQTSTSTTTGTAGTSSRGRGDSGRGGGRGSRNNGGRGGRGRGGQSSGGGGGINENGAAAERGVNSNGNGNGNGETRRRGGGGGGGRGGRRGGGVGGGGHQHSASAEGGIQPKGVASRPLEAKAGAAGADGNGNGDDDDDSEVCFICANPVVHHSIAPCNHITCHICALRMRALYRNKGCPHCRTDADFVIFTDDPARRFEEYTAADIDAGSTDTNIGVKYTTADIADDTRLLLRYNCPDGACDYAGLGWPDLHRHVRTVHHKKMCDLCTRFKKVFTHEHELFSDKGLEKHMRNGDDRPGAVDQTGFKGHPLCGFCGERFYDGDKLYEHCRNKHERCFLCDRRSNNNSDQPHYYRNYAALESHFRTDHYLCFDRECMEKKFVVFDSEMDLKAHQLAEHYNSLSKDVRRDVQVVSLSDFDVRPSYQTDRRGGGGHGHGHGQPSGSGSGRPSRGRDPNADMPPAISASQPLRRDEVAFQRQLAIHTAAPSNTRTFGSQLSAPVTAPSPAAASSSSAAPSRPRTTTPNNNANLTPAPIDPLEALNAADAASLTPTERARLARHGAVIERAANLLGRHPTKMAAFRANISHFSSGLYNAPQLVEAFHTLFADTSHTALGSLLREVADLFDDPAKAASLRAAWNDWRAGHEDYPSLPAGGSAGGSGSGGSVGWAAAAASPAPGLGIFGAGIGNVSVKHSTRVLKLKNSTRPGGSSSNGGSGSGLGPSGRSVPGATWTVPSGSSGPPAASAAAAFPALPSSSSSRNSASSLVGKKPAAASSGWGQVNSGTPTATPSSSSSLAARLGYNSGGSSNSSSRRSTPAIGGASSSGLRQPPVSEESFPSLPAAPKPQTTIFGYGRGAVRRDFNANRDTGFSWGGGGGSGATAGPADDEDADDAANTGKGKKKGKQGKKVLVQWG